VRGTKKDYYEILGVPRDATKEQIDAAFAKLAMRWHPDRVPPEQKEEAERRFKEISEAYSILSDPEKRRLYDMGVDPEGGIPHAGAYDFMGMGLDEIFERIFGGGFGDIFGDIFGGGARTRTRVESEEDLDVHVEVPMSLSEILTGAEKRVRYRRRAPCPTCGGEGVLNPRTCHVCGGRGRVREHRRSFFGTFVVERPCPNCRGAGVEGERCGTCGGKGFVVEEVDRSFHIPAGVLDGQKVIYRGMGHRGRRGVGRLVIHIREMSDPKYERMGRNIVYTMDITPPRAVLGGEVAFRGPTGERLKVRVPEGVQEGEIFAKVEGKGIPDPKGGRPGDLLVRAHIKVPTKLSRLERDLYRQLLELEEKRLP